MSYTVHRLILSYGFFIVPGCDLVCGVLCTWCELCQVIWSDRTNCYIRLSGTHWENPSEWKRGCGAIWWFDVWYSAKSGILFDCRAYYWVVQNVIPNWRRFPKWERGLYLLCGCVGLWLYRWIDWLCRTLGLVLWSALTWKRYMVLVCCWMYGYLVWVIWADIVQSAIYG